MNQPEAAGGGRERLIQAALRLASRTRSLTHLGIRELAREADLNPNTFYRHFGTIEDLGLAAISVVAAELKPLLHLLQETAAHQKPEHMFRQVAEGYFAFASAHPEAILLGLAELHGSSSVLRQALEQLLDDLADQMTSDAISLQLAPGIDAATLREISGQIVVWFFQAAGRVVEYPDQRAALTSAGENLARRLYLAAISEANPLTGLLGALKLRPKKTVPT